MKTSHRPHGNSTTDQAQEAGRVALDTYLEALHFLAKSGISRRPQAPAGAPLPFLHGVESIQNLYLSLSAVAPATPDAPDEEWNPLSQRPHAPLPPAVSDELGAEVTSLKEAVDAFTTLSHEMMHVALWEPFFVGRWRPRSRRVFHEFSLMAEGFCFFFSDIVIAGAVRVRLPDGEFALERQTPSNAHFPPLRAFHALGIQDHPKILDIYLDGFSGQRTRLWQREGTNDFAAALAMKTYDFYKDSLPYLDGMHAALASFGALSEFHKGFCAIPGLPTFLPVGEDHLPAEGDLKPFFMNFLGNGLGGLARLTPAQVRGVRWRRMLQMRAYYALQVRWFLREGLVMARALSAPKRRRILDHVEAYLAGLRETLQGLGRRNEASPMDALSRLDAGYDAQVRSRFLDHDAWAGQRWLIAPRRAGGCVSAFGMPPAKVREAKAALVETVEFLVDELALRMRENASVTARAELMAHIQRVAALGAAAGQGDAARVHAAWRKLRTALARPPMREIWSLPLASFDPVDNQFRELLFSYQ